MSVSPNWFFLALALTTCDVTAEQDRCGDLSTLRYNSGFRGESCQCGKVLDNLTVATPKGMRLRAVCQLHATDGGRYRPIDLKKEKVSLDSYTASGDYYSGVLLFSGTILVDGVVRVGPAGNSGDMWFSPESPLAPYKSVFADHYITELKLLTSAHGKQFNVPKQENPLLFSCWRAVARISLRGIEVQLSEDDSNGAYPVGLEVSGRPSFTKVKCETQ